MEAFNNFVTTINGFVWGPVMLCLLIGTHVILTIRTKVIPIKQCSLTQTVHPDIDSTC